MSNLGDNASWTSYPKLWNLGHPNTQRIFKAPVVIQEKVDGSQFSFGVIEGELRVKSRRVELNLDHVQDLFAPAVETVKRLYAEGKLVEGWTYRGEAFKSPKHNTLTYARVPRGHIMLFDIAIGPEKYVNYETLVAEGDYLGLEVVPLIFEGDLSSIEDLNALLDRESVLGGVKIEGIAIKSATIFLDDGKPLYAKVVSEAFREVHHKDWKNRHPSGKDIIELLIDTYRTEARWRKAVQRLRDAGTLENSPRDIGALVTEVQADIREECEAEIKDALFAWAWRKMSSAVAGGLPQWYREQLAMSVFEDTESAQK